MLGCRIAVCLIIASPFFVAGRSLAAPVNLGEIERTLKREPAYAEKPRYCLLVFGADARTKVWLVLDGEDLYVDLNANGDLTEPGERFIPENRRNLGESPDGGYRDWEYQLGEVVPAGDAARHTRFEVKAYQLGDKPLCHIVCVWVNGTVQQYAGWGEIFEARREDAPVIHFGAPVICRQLRGHGLSRKAKVPEFHLCFGTPGLGKRSFAFVGYETFPKQIEPRLAIEWPTAGGPKRTAAALDGRC